MTKASWIVFFQPQAAEWTSIGVYDAVDAADAIAQGSAIHNKSGRYMAYAWGSAVVIPVSLPPNPTLSKLEANPKL